jgi:UDPglucose 6-dehydrogenase
MDLGEEKLSRIEFTESPMDALTGAEALLIVTEWKAFRSPDFEEIKARLRNPVIIDGRNLYEPALMTGLGIEYHGIGRSVLTSK